MIPTSRKQYFTIVGTIVGILLAALIGASIVSAFLVDESEIANDQATQAAQDIISEVTIPIEFLENGPLQDFAPYEPLEAPDGAGRDNPFSPAPPSQPQP